MVRPLRRATPVDPGFAFLAMAGVLLAIGAGQTNYLWMLPGLLVYGTGVAIVLTVNDPVSLDTVPDSDHGRRRWRGCRT